MSLFLSNKSVSGSFLKGCPCVTKRSAPKAQTISSQRRMISSSNQTRETQTISTVISTTQEASYATKTCEEKLVKRNLLIRDAREKCTLPKTNTTDPSTLSDHRTGMLRKIRFLCL